MSPDQQSSVPVGHLSIVGMGRSGSTYLEAKLANDLDGVAVGELPGIWRMSSQRDRYCSCGSSALECPFWSEVSSRYDGLHDERVVQEMTHLNRLMLPVKKAPLWPYFSHTVRRPSRPEHSYLRHMRGLYAALRETASAMGYRVVVDSSKHPLWYDIANRGEILNAMSPRTAVRLIRHPRAVAYSLRRPRLELTASGGAREQQEYSLPKAVPYWLIMNLSADIATRNNRVVVRYEDLASIVSADDVSFLTEAPGFKRLGQSGPTGGPTHQITGNPSRHMFREGFREDTRWTDERLTLSADLMWRALTPILHRYGYGHQPPRSRPE